MSMKEKKKASGFKMWSLIWDWDLQDKSAGIWKTNGSTPSFIQK